MASEIEQLLTQGLLAGYGSGTSKLIEGKYKSQQSQRAGIEINVSHYESPDGGIYEDQWVNGGGQELVQLPDGKKFTRVYGGKVIQEDKLKKLKITHVDISTFLKFAIRKLKDKTRLFEGAELSDQRWRYQYEIKESDISFPLTIGRESITYRNKPVFVHWFILSPVE